MKKLLIIIGGIIFALGVGIGVMYYFDICPPPGPWKIPPWCEKYDFVRPTYELDVQTSYLSQIPAVNMSDTWGMNYNFGMIENTRKNIESSFDRVQELGGREVYVHDFHRAVYDDEQDFASLDYEIEDEIFLNDFRDESLSEKDVRQLASAAHERGLRLGIKHNIAFVDIGKYIGSKDIDSEVQVDFASFNNSHSEEWIRDFFAKWKARLLDRAAIYEEAGVDIMSITPTWMGPTFAGHEELANNLWKDLITDIRKNFSGDIHVIVDRYGFVDGKNGNEDWTKYDYYIDADIIEFDIYALRDPYGVRDNPTVAQMRGGFSSYFDAIEEQAMKKGVGVSIFFAPFSYPNAINEGIIEYHDVLKDSLANTQKDWGHQADAYQAFFEALQGRKTIDRFIVGGYWWDDAMDPDVKVRISLSPSVRNKPAEEVIKQWLAMSNK